MPVEVILPKVDMDMATGRIVTWHVPEGGTVAKGDPLFDIETDKAAMEVESPGAGTLRHVTAPEGTEVPIGEPVAWIYADGERVEDAPPGATPARDDGPGRAGGPDDAPAERGGPGDAPPAKAPSAPSRTDTGPTAGLRATPAARKLATERGVELRDLNGSGPRGRVQRADVEELASRAGAPPVRSRATDAPATAARARPDETGALSVLSGGGGPSVPWVLIHGLAGDATAWAGLADDLERTAPVHRIELPGHGRSPRRAVADFADLARQVRAAFDALGEEPVRLVGHSLGGAVALALADVRPRRIAELTLIAPAGLGPRIDGPTLAGLVRAGRAESLGPWLKELVADPDAISWTFVQAAMLQRSDPDLRAAQAEMTDVLFPDGTQSFDLRAALERVDCPARIVWGRRDRIIPWEHALRAPGHVALHLFDGVGHLPHLECPGALRRLLG